MAELIFESTPGNNLPRHSNANFHHSFPSRTFVHASLEVSGANDPEEVEADSVAKAVVNGGMIRRNISTGGNSSGIKVSNGMEQRLFSQLGKGSKMPDGLRSRMEHSFGRDFSDVRCHTDTQASEMSRSIHAKAFTYGKDIFFNQGQFSPESRQGQELVAHELTHVVQGGPGISRQVSDEGQPSGISYGEKQILEISVNELILFISSDMLPLYRILERHYSNRQELDYIGGVGIAASRSELDSRRRKRQIEVIRGTLDNLRNGVIAGVSTLAAGNDPEDIYLASQLGAVLDTAFTGIYGEKTYGGPMPAGRRGKDFNYGNVREAEQKTPSEKVRESRMELLIEQRRKDEQNLKQQKRIAGMKSEVKTMEDAQRILTERYKAEGTAVSDYSKIRSIKALEQIKETYQRSLDMLFELDVPDVQIMRRAITNMGLIDSRIEIIKKQQEINQL